MKQALFIKTKNLGDAVVLTAAIKALPRDYALDILCFRDCAELYSGIPSVDRIWSVTRGQRGLVALSEGISLFRSLHARKYDLLCHFSDDWRGALLARFLRPRLSVAFESEKRPSFWNRSFSILAKRSNVRRHAAELDVDLLRRSKVFKGDTPSYIPPHIHGASRGLQNYLTETGLAIDGYLVVHLASRWQFKELPPDTSVELLRELVDRGFRVVLTGDKNDSSKLRYIRDQLHTDSVYLCIGRTLGEFSELLKGASAVISIDSLALHLASAHQTPVIAIFGPSGELNWRPWKTPHRVVSQIDRYPCRPCGMDGCAGSKVSECLRTMPVSQILEALDGLIPVGLADRGKAGLKEK